jgi:cold shock CspA family protein
MRYGTIVRYDPGKGFGFIRPYFGPDVFFHVTALGACVSKPQIAVDQPVKFELVPEAELKAQRPVRRGQGSKAGNEPLGPEARLVELIEKLPGADLEIQSRKLQTARHPRARKKKPTWRREKRGEKSHGTGMPGTSVDGR